MSDNTLIPPGVVGGDTIRTIDRVTAKTQVVQLDAGGESGAFGENLVTSSNPLPVQVQNQPDVPLVDDDGIPYVNPNVPGADIATGDKQTQILNLLTQLIALTGSTAVTNFPSSTAVSNLPANPALENAGNLQRIADNMELVLLELRVVSTLISQLGQATPDSPDQIRGDPTLLQ